MCDNCGNESDELQECTCGDCLCPDCIDGGGNHFGCEE